MSEKPEGVKEAEALDEIIKYIEQRERNLSRYSSKLRRSVTRIADIFGSSEKCRICNHSDRIYLNSIRKRDAPVKYINASMTHEEVIKDTELHNFIEDFELHEFKPKIYISTDYNDIETFYESDKYVYRLAFRDSELVALLTDKEYSEEFTKDFYDISREALKSLIKSGKLIKFIGKVAEQIKAKEQEYQEVAEIAEKLAKAVNP